MQWDDPTRWLSTWLSERMDAPVTPLRVRLKPGTSAVLAARAGEDLVLVQAYAPHAAPKLAKTVRRAGKDVVALDPEQHVIAVRAIADRDLPGLRDLPPHTVLSYNPQRRLVARIDTTEGPRVVRVVRPRAHASITRGVRLLDGAAGTPRLLGEMPQQGLSTLSWQPGRALDGTCTADALRSAGAAIARLHAVDVELPLLTGTRLAPRRTTRLLAHLLPEEAARLARLTAHVERRTAALPHGTPRVLHGDLSRDQLVVDGAEVSLLDLDRAGRGETAYDLGSLLADDIARGYADGQRPLDAFLDGYAAHAPLPSAEALAAHTAAHLLQRAAEPFRTAHPAWRAQCRHLIGEVEQQCLLSTRS